MATGRGALSVRCPRGNRRRRVGTAASRQEGQGEAGQRGRQGQQDGELGCRVEGLGLASHLARAGRPADRGYLFIFSGKTPKAEGAVERGDGYRKAGRATRTPSGVEWRGPGCRWLGTGV